MPSFGIRDFAHATAVHPPARSRGHAAAQSHEEHDMTVSITSRLTLAAAIVLATGTSLADGALRTTTRAPQPAHRPAPPQVPYLDWTDCGDGFQCATATVPLDYDHPRGRTVQIALIRRPAIDQANRIGSLFLNPGGPGQSGIDFVRAAPPPAFQAVSRFDVIGFDPRGLGASRPAVLDCGDSPAFRSPLPRPDSVDKLAFLVDTFDYVRDCRVLNRDLLAHLSSANVARDLDLLRAAVGDPRLNYLGFSYGSVIGATYASLFPGRARAMVLDSPIDVQKYYDNPNGQWREHAGGHEHVLDRFMAACTASPAGCGFGGADPKAAFDALLARLDVAPIPSSDPADPRLLDGDTVRFIFESGLRARFLWPFLAQGLSLAQQGDGGGLLAFAGGSGNPARDDFQNGVLGVDQEYRRWPILDYFTLAERSYRDFPHFWFLSGYWDLVRAQWLAEDFDAFRGRIRNPSHAAPILLVGMTHDPATPYFQAERLAADLGNARLLTFDADGHGAITTLDPCVLENVTRYLDDGILPAPGTTCVQQGTPFPAAAARKAQRPVWNLDDTVHFVR
jgi:pimeloyl-ACP methyl ester carboxylesterase